MQRDCFVYDCTRREWMDGWSVLMLISAHGRMVMEGVVWWRGGG